MKHLKSILIVLLIFTTVSCSNDDDAPQDDDIQQLVENFVTPDLIQTLEDLGFNFRDGDEQPDISGGFIFSPHILQSTTIENDFAQPGQQFLDNTFTFSNLNPENRTFSVSIIDGNGDGSGSVTDTFYSGMGNDFSAYVKLSVTVEGETAVILLAITGTITENGMVNCQDAVIMLDNMGNPNGTFIENSEGRLLIDQDGTASRL